MLLRTHLIYFISSILGLNNLKMHNFLTILIIFDFLSISSVIKPTMRKLFCSFRSTVLEPTLGSDYIQIVMGEMKKQLYILKASRMSACFVMTYYPIHCPIYRLSSCQNSQTGTVCSLNLYVSVCDFGSLICFYINSLCPLLMD